MPRYSEKSQYKIKNKRVIYLMRSPLSKEFFIGHCQPNSIMPIFRQHCAGERYQTKVCFLSLKEHGLHPCLTILEEIYSTQVEAYNHVVAWTKIFVNAGFISINTGNILNYIEDLNKKSKAVYEKNKDKNIAEICNCKACTVANYGYKKCPYNSGDPNDNK